MNLEDKLLAIDAAMATFPVAGVDWDVVSDEGQLYIQVYDNNIMSFDIPTRVLIAESLISVGKQLKFRGVQVGLKRMRVRPE